MLKNSRDLPDGNQHRSYPVARNYSRMGDTKLSAAATARRSNYAPSTQDHNGGHKHKFNKLAKEAFKPGVIVRAVVHEPNIVKPAHASSVTVADRQVTDTMYGQVISKVRKLIVVSTHYDHYTAVPLYTHNGHGLSRKSKPDEYVSVQDHRQSDPFKQLSVHIPLVTGHLNRDVNPYDPVTTAHVPYLVSRPYVLPVCHEGSLEPDSTRRLLELVGKRK